MSRHVQSFFTDYLRARRNASPQTIFSYRDSIRMLLEFAATLLGHKVERLLLPRM